MKIMLDKGAKMPTRAHTWDAGLDLYATEDCVVPATQTRVVCDPFEVARTETMVETKNGDSKEKAELKHRPSGRCHPQR